MNTLTQNGSWKRISKWGLCVGMAIFLILLSGHTEPLEAEPVWGNRDFLGWVKVQDFLEAHGDTSAKVKTNGETIWIQSEDGTDTTTISKDVILGLARIGEAGSDTPTVNALLRGSVDCPAGEALLGDGTCGATSGGGGGADPTLSIQAPNARLAGGDTLVFHQFDAGASDTVAVLSAHVTPDTTNTITGLEVALRNTTDGADIYTTTNSTLQKNSDGSALATSSTVAGDRLQFMVRNDSGDTRDVSALIEMRVNRP